MASLRGVQSGSTGVARAIAWQRGGRPETTGYWALRLRRERI